MYAPACPWRTDELTKRATDGLTTLANRRQVRCARDEPPTTDRRKAGGKRTAPYAGERTPHGWARAPVAEDPRAADPARLVPLVRDGTLHHCRGRLADDTTIFAVRPRPSVAR